MTDIHLEIALELSKLERAAHDRVRRRNAEQQRGEAWVDLGNAYVEVRPSEVAQALPD
jgi:hypothetical protein